MSELMNEHCGDYLDLMRDFQVFKRNVDTTSDKAFIIRIPASLSDVSKEYMQKSFSEAVASSAYAGVMKVVGNKLKMSACAARDLFRKVIDKVTRQMEQCIDDVSKIAPARTISLILMVGGFSESQFVQETIKNRFEDVDGMKVLVPENAGQAVLKGAVIFGRQQDSITSRRMRQGNMATGGTDTCVLSDEIFDLLCTVCKRKGKNTEAEKFCFDCGDYYCLTCVKVHDDVPLLTGHKILGKNQFQSMSIRMKPPVPTERCDKHSHKHIDMYCKYHDEVGCSTCMATEH
ncbi:heat shock 70 kDa protein 12A-like, partial [Mercenaria mercenaria]|uniref:heat shock 70 kDa protein 12A-like n=1 Tax=Mercenaria mercenaria TaxID=6596 RepID=UPI00234F926C